MPGAVFNPETVWSPWGNPIILASGAGCNELISWCFDKNYIHVRKEGKIKSLLTFFIVASRVFIAIRAASDCCSCTRWSHPYYQVLGGGT